MGNSTVAVRSAGQVVLAVCVAASLALAVIPNLDVLDRPHFSLAALIGLSVGAFMALTYLPLIWWAYRQFRWDAAFGPLLLWVIVNAVSAAAQWLPSV